MDQRLKTHVVVALCMAISGPAFALETQTQDASRLTDTAVTATNYGAGYIWKQDASGTSYGPYASMAFKQKLYSSFLADVGIHLYATSSSDNGVDAFLDRAEFSWHGPWLTIAGGRREVGEFLSPANYFGAYETMGERTLDMVSATFPFRFFADVPDAEATVSAPYNAFSFVYIPNIFSTAKAELDGKGGIMLGQLRVKYGVSGSSSDLIINYARGLQDYFEYSTLSLGGSLDASYAFSYKFAQVFGEYAFQDLNEPNSTSVALVGGRINLHNVTWGLFDSLEGEYQIPTSADVDNPFTGGNPQNPLIGAAPQRAWFVQLVHKSNIRQPTQPARFYFGAAVTNSVGDYTLSRLREGSISVPVSPGFGAAPRIQFLPFVSSDYATLAGLAYAGYEF